MPGARGGTLRRGGPGRPKGLPPAFFKLFEDGDESLGLPPRRERFIALLTCDDLGVRLRAEQLLLEHQHGKPAQAVDVTSDGASVRFVVEAPPAETSEEWLARHAASRKAVEEIEYGEAN